MILLFDENLSPKLEVVDMGALRKLCDWGWFSQFNICITFGHTRFEEQVTNQQ